ncbi:hypothetical protein CBL_09830 [Carabus blaptoides fortunei]
MSKFTDESYPLKCVVIRDGPIASIICNFHAYTSFIFHLKNFFVSRYLRQILGIFSVEKAWSFEELKLKILAKFCESGFARGSMACWDEGILSLLPWLTAMSTVT